MSAIYIQHVILLESNSRENIVIEHSCMMEIMQAFSIARMYVSNTIC